MPKQSKQAQPSAADVPSTVARSGQYAVDTWQKTHDSAVESYGEGERAHRTAFAALKHTHEKVGDHWEPKDDKGPSDEQAARKGASSGKDVPTAEGVNANATKAHLVEVAKKVGIRNAAAKRKDDLVEEIQRANRRLTDQARRADT